MYKLLFAASLLSISASAMAQQADAASSYLMVYFTDQDHSIHFATSPDGYTFTAVNDAYAIISGDSIADQRGVRDPYIMQLPDGTFLLAATDLHINAQREGKRETQWERPGEQYDWGNNRSIVLLRSDDLIHWTHTLLTIADMPGYEEIGCAWAPQMLWDEAQQAVLIYWTMRWGTGINQVYYAYLNESLDALATEPTLIMQLPDEKSFIDADITQGNDGRWYMTYVSHQGRTPGLKVAVADKATGPYTYREEYIDHEEKACEAPMVWRRQGTDTFVVMADCYGINPNNFGFYETEDFETFRDLGHFNDSIMQSTNFSRPKHGAVIPISATQAEQLQQYWQEHPDHTTDFHMHQPRRQRPEPPTDAQGNRPTPPEGQVPPRTDF